MTITLRRWVRLAVMLAFVVTGSMLMPNNADAQPNPGTGGGNCVLCQYDFTDLENIIPSCSGGYDIGYEACMVTGNYCYQSAECSTSEEAHAFDVSLTGQLVATAVAVYDPAPWAAKPQMGAARYVTLLSSGGRVPCKPAAQSSITVVLKQDASKTITLGL